MTTFTREVEIVFSEHAHSPRLTGWLQEIGRRVDDLPNLKIDVKVTVDIEDFEGDDIVDAYDKINEADDDDRFHIGRAYRALAEGDVTEAMEILSRQFDLAPPSHERAIGDLLTAKRG
jgi:hypothetical protein